MTEKSREQKLRRAAKRQGLIAVKGRGQSDGWMILDARKGNIECGGDSNGYSLTLEEAENYVYDE